MATKRDVTVRNNKIGDLVGPRQNDSGGDTVMFASNLYLGIGCDMRNTSALSEALESRLQLNDCHVLCIAEVSIAYMNPDAADSLIEWSARFDDVRFCLLEQCLPDGPEHPFAKKMLKHFENLRVPLNCVRSYPSLTDQESRFLQAGYDRAKAQTLWDLWQDPLAVSSEERLRVNRVEPFDEWEELALFGSHYFILEATKSPNARLTQSPLISSSHQATRSAPTLKAYYWSSGQSTLVAHNTRTNAGRRRKFGSIIPTSANAIGFHGGIGKEGRQSDTDRYRLTESGEGGPDLPDPPSNIKPRVSHTITEFSKGKTLLAGGRTSPDQALSGCWLRRGKDWNAVGELPIPLYRHCAVVIACDTEDAGVLIFGGKTTGGAVVNSWFLWREAFGWKTVMLPSHEITGRFGAMMAATGASCGILLGGMTDEGILCDETWKWEIAYGHGQTPRLSLSPYKDASVKPRMGASLVRSPVGLLLIGGISSTLIRQAEEILCIVPKAVDDSQDSATFETIPVITDFGDVRPFLVGHSAFATEDTVLIVGGGAVCFSFGSLWNEDIWTLTFSANNAEKMPTQRWIPEERDISLAPQPYTSHIADIDLAPCADFKDKAETAVHVELKSAEHFDQLIAKERPCLLKDQVVVHQAQSSHLNFQTKNFRYVKKPFGEFIQEACNGSRQYLRSLNEVKPSDEPASVYDDFPSLQDEFTLPEQFETVRRNQHIVGRKKVALYPPSDAIRFQIPPGSSSSPIDVFADDVDRRGEIKYPQNCIEATMNDGDVLFIPPLWLHSTAPMDNFSVSINIFFRNLESGYAAGRDVYGNRNLQAYENGRKTISKMVKSFDGLPRDIGSAYLLRLADELKQEAEKRQMESL
ncbi:MAG: hypothetical protein Q9222_007143 [Ikaeria aurantiellina]